ncbi:NAD(P)-dependent oxidoreductase [Nesterenkonia ebinurensis]|uniref:NAD(P)-dependent oxidoreductase n=1 Tax=Nesterenkonia ebinurensis TaxID=2608252 RepID=UPI001CC62019|nr:NAD(P)-dependent oxidoreductase [Nesterenkonia ebinurensis]
MVTEGGRLVDVESVLQSNPQIKWVQLPSAGIERYRRVIARYPEVAWTSAKGAYARPVAEHALALTLAALRGFKMAAAATSWRSHTGLSLHKKRCVVIGAGGIAAEIVRLYKVFDASVTVIRRRPEPLANADTTVTFTSLDEALRDAEIVCLAAAVTPETEQLMGAHQFNLLSKQAVLVNIGRGKLVDTDALVDALNAGKLFGAGLDVTDPEPLPKHHPLWNAENCLITPHIANTAAAGRPLLHARIIENHRRLRDGEALLGRVDIAQGY